MRMVIVVTVIPGDDDDDDDDEWDHGRNTVIGSRRGLYRFYDNDSKRYIDWH